MVVVGNGLRRPQRPKAHADLAKDIQIYVGVGGGEKNGPTLGHLKGCPGALLGREVAQSQRLTSQKETTSDCDYVEDEDGDGDGSAGGRLGASFRPHDDGDLDE